MECPLFYLLLLLLSPSPSNSSSPFYFFLGGNDNVSSYETVWEVIKIGVTQDNALDVYKEKKEKGKENERVVMGMEIRKKRQREGRKKKIVVTENRRSKVNKVSGENNCIPSNAV